MSDEREDRTIYKVVINHEEQYSVWPADRELPLGWSDAGKRGPKAECLAYALAHDERFGIWGGLSERERRRLKRRTA